MNAPPSEEVKAPDVCSPWEDQKSKILKEIQQLNDAENRVVGQIESLKKTLEDIRVRREGWAARLEGGDVAIQLYKEWAKTLIGADK